MRVIACITLLIWGAISTKNASGTFCSSGSLSPHTGFCYHVHPEKNAKVKDSRKICRDTYGGDIPSIFSDDENTFIKNLLEPESHEHYWIGVNDRLVEDDFRDVMRNERLNYSHWKANEPDNAFYADCAAMERSSGEWIDYSCSTLSYFAVGIICQQPPNPNPYTLCPANMLNYVASSGTECYWFSMDKLTALQAVSHCASMGSKLAFIEDQVLDLFLYSYQQSAEMDTLWIGTQQLLDSSGQSYRSVEFGTTTPVYYDNFMSTYSGNETLVCAAKISSEGGKWNQLNCDEGTYHFVCRFINGTETNTSTETTVATTTTTIPSTTPANTTIHTTTEATTPSTTNPTTTAPTTESTTAVLTTTQATTTPTTTEPTTPKPTTTEEDTTTLPSTTATTTHNPTTTAVTTTIPTTYSSTTQPDTTDRVTTITATTTQATTSETTATSISISTEATAQQTTPVTETVPATTTVPMVTTDQTSTSSCTGSCSMTTKDLQTTPVTTMSPTTPPVTMVSTQSISTSSTCFNGSCQTTTVMQPCFNNPCTNGGTCVEDGEGFTCQCPSGFQGTTCQTVVNSCSSHTCLNGATCEESTEGAVCQCPFGYEGIHCETDLTPNFNFSQARVLEPADFGVDRSSPQPYYMLADHYNTLQMKQANDHQEIVDEPCRNNMMDCIKLTGATSRLNPMTSITGTCLHQVENCPQGFAISLWLFLETEAIDGVPSKLLSVEDGTLNVPYVRLMITAQRAIEFSVNDGTTIFRSKISAGKVRWNQWFNLGASWKPGSVPLLFINSKPRGQSSQSDVTEPMDTSTNRNVWIGSQETADSSAPVTVSDFVYWDRFLFEFENHRFLGITDEEKHLLFNADLWWTVDGFTRRDHLLLGDYQNQVALTTPIRTDENAVVVLTTGKDGKGKALDVNGEDGFWLYFGDHDGTCISDPSLCEDGITVATWMRLTDYHDNEFHCLLSSGGQTTRGFAIYQTGQKIRAMVANGERQWIVEAPFEQFGEWSHIALTWNLTTGLYLYLDGNTRGIDLKGVYRVREADLDNKLIVGRRNDFLSDFARLGFEELAIWERFVEPWEARHVFGFFENSVYSKADIYWAGETLISSMFDLLETGKTDGIIPGPNLDITIATEDDDTFVELHPNSYLTLGSFPDSCLIETDTCLSGFSLSIWLQTPINAPITGSHLNTESRSFTLTVTYYTAVAIVKTSDLVWTTTVPIEKRGSWYNIAMTWNRFERLAVYVDGIEPEGATSTTETNLDVQPSSVTKVGISSTTEGTLITDLAVWYQFTYPRKAFTLMGLTDPEGYCQSSGRYCWTFQPPLNRVNPFVASETGVSYTTSSNYTGKSVVTDGMEGVLTLGDYAGMCPSDPSQCEFGFALGLWVNLEPPETADSSVKHIISLGADKNGEKGMALIHAEGNIRAIVADGTKRWEVDTLDHNVTYNKWMYIGMIWEATNGLQITFDGVQTAEKKAGTVSTRNNEAYSVITVGKSAVYPIGYQAGAYDEIMIVVPETVSDIPVPEDLNGVGSVRYRSADEYFDVTDPSGPVEAVNTSLVEDRFHSQNGAISTGNPANHNFGYVSIGDYAGKCLSDPSVCSPAGMTVSFWIELGTIDHFQDVATNPEGLGYILSSGAQVANSRGFSVTYDGETVTTEVVGSTIMWTASFDDANFGRNWTNFAITWSSVSGLEILTDGKLRATDALGTPLSSTTTDTHTVVHLGKRNDQDSGYLGGAFDDVAVWIYTINYEDDDELSQLMGELGLDDIFITDDYTQLLNSGPTTGKEECRVLHEADCARSLMELEDIANEELIFGIDAATSMRRRMLHLAQTEDSLSRNELAAAVNVASTLALFVQPFNNKTQAENAIEEFLETVDALLDSERKEEWQELQKTKPGSTELVHSLEDYIAQAARDLETSDTFLGCQEFYETANIATCVDKFMADSFGSDGPVTLPIYGNESEWSGVEARWNNLKEEVTLPQNLFDFTRDGDEGILVLSMYDALDEVIPRNASEDFVSTSTNKPWVNSRVISLKVYPSLRRDLYNPVSMVFVHNMGISEQDVDTPVCSFWNYYLPDTIGGSWDKTGCQMVSTNRTHTTCECVHFTHFAILMEPPPPPPPDIVDMVFVWSARALAGVSETLLFLLICVFVCCTRVRSLRHLIHAHVALSCMLSIQFLCLATLEWTPLICLVMGALFEYFCLVFAFWLLIESIQGLSDVHFGYRQADRIITSCPVPERYYGYMCLAWGAPGLVVGVTIAININAFQELNSGLCWVTDEHDLYLSFYGPLGVCFCLTMLFMFIVRRSVDKFFNTETLSSSMLATCVISIVNVGAWAAGYLGFYGPTIVAYYIYLLTYASMGIFIFVMFGIKAGQLKLIFGKNLKGHRKIRGIGNGRNTPVEKITITQDQDNTGKKRKKKKKGKKPVTYVAGGKDHWSRESSKLPGRTNASVRIQPRADNEKKIILS